MTQVRTIKEQLRTLLRRTPMTVYAVVFGLLVGGIVWEVLDKIQTRTLNAIFRQELVTVLDQRAREALIRFDHLADSYSALTRLLVNDRRLTDYLAYEYRSLDEGSALKEYRTEQPPWLPEASRWLPPVSPSHVALLDMAGRFREIYWLTDSPPPEQLFTEAGGFLAQSRLNAVLTVLDDKPYLMVASLVENGESQVVATMLVVVPIDTVFLNGAQGQPQEEVVTAVLDDDAQVVLASSSPSKVAVLSGIEGLDRRYAITYQSFFDYEGSDLGLEFVTLVPRDRIRQVTSRVARLERRQRATAALVFIAVYSLLFMVVSNRLARALRRLSDFSQRALGFTHPTGRGGNQLLILEDWMREYIGRVRDAREEMRARHETEIQASAALTSAIMEASLDSIITIDETGRIVEFNPTAERTFGHDRAHAVGADITSLILDEPCRERFRKLLETCLREQGPPVADVRTEMMAIRQDGAAFPVELAIKPIDLQGRILFTAYLHDISERRRQEEEIRTLAAFPSESPTPILRVNRPGVISYANDASEPLLQYWGCQRGQTLPLNWRIRIQRALDSGRHRELEIPVGDRVFSMLLAPIAELDYVNMYARDVTEARVAEAQARQHQTELVHVCRLSTMGEMATGIAHELNQPLSAIVNYANGSRRRLELGQLDTETLKEPLNQIASQAARAAEIIRRLRALVSRQSTQRRPVQINSLVQEVLSFVDYELRKLMVQVDSDLGTELPSVRADLVQVEQVILNLIRNAVDAVRDNPPNERRIWIGTRMTAGGRVAVEVSDNGAGLSPETHQRLFEPFFSTKKTGMGMGLAISQTIAVDHGGKILAAERPGGGAAFTLELPALAFQEAAGVL